MIDTSIAFIGGGNMASAMIGGLVKTGFQQEHLWVSDPGQAQREAIQQIAPQANVVNDNCAALEHSQVTLLAVKPQIMRQVCEQLRASAQRTKPLIISIAAGLRQADIDRWLGGQLAIVRVMPNQPALIGKGASAAFANARCTAQQRNYAEQILRTAGALVWLKSEAEIDAATAISGSGPAYFFLLMEMMYEQALSFGLDTQSARTLVMNTAIGASAMADQSALTLQKLREQVTSPGGTTEAAVTHLLDNDLRKIFAAALDAARDRAQQMADDAANT